MEKAKAICTSNFLGYVHLRSVKCLKVSEVFSCSIWDRYVHWMFPIVAAMFISCLLFNTVLILQ